MPQVESAQANPEPRYTILVVQHLGEEEPEMALDRGTAEEAKSFIMKVRAAFPAIVVAGAALMGGAIHQLAHLHYLTQL